MRSVAVLSELELTILGLIRSRPQSGYELRKALAASPGAVYPALKRLAAAGFLVAKPDLSTGRKKETFHVSAAGRRTLQSALQKPTIEEVRRDPQAVAARLQFLNGGAAGAFLAEYARLSSICAAELTAKPGLLAGHDAELYLTRARWAAKAAKGVIRQSR